jgi:hypothetical protein
MDHTLFLDSLDVTCAPQKRKTNFRKPASWGRAADNGRPGRNCATFGEVLKGGGMVSRFVLVSQTWSTAPLFI